MLIVNKSRKPSYAQVLKVKANISEKEHTTQNPIYQLIPNISKKLTKL